ncbi:MAG: hypothetical protein ABIV63_16550 [Caldimonas sp.]
MNSNRVSNLPPPGMPKVRVLVRSTLRCAEHSPNNRRRAQDLAWAWVGAKWPRLLPPASDLKKDSIECSLPGQELSATVGPDGTDWTLSVAHSERGGGRIWMTRALVADDGDADVIGVQTSCTEVARSPMVIAPPRVLGLWVEHLDLNDGGFAVIGEARNVDDSAQAGSFCNHVLSAQRTLPVIALMNSPRSRYYGVDPRGLAEAVRGMAHVACLSSELAGDVAQRLGENFVPVSGAARIYVPGFGADARPEDHPLLRPAPRDADSRVNDAGAFRRVLLQTVCALSVGAPAHGARFAKT